MRTQEMLSTSYISVDYAQIPSVTSKHAVSSRLFVYLEGVLAHCDPLMFHVLHYIIHLVMHICLAA